MCSHSREVNFRSNGVSLGMPAHKLDINSLISLSNPGDGDQKPAILLRDALACNDHPKGLMDN